MQWQFLVSRKWTDPNGSLDRNANRLTVLDLRHTKRVAERNGSIAVCRFFGDNLAEVSSCAKVPEDTHCNGLTTVDFWVEG